MAEKLGEIGDVLSGISKAVRTMKLLRDKNEELSRITENTKKRAIEVEDLKMSDEPLLKELKLKLSKVGDSGSKLEVLLKNVCKEIYEFDRFVREKIEGSIPPEGIKEFCEKLTQGHKMASDFSAAFEDFIGHLTKSQKLATDLTDRLSQKKDEMKKQAGSTRNWGAAKSAGLAIGGAGLVAIGFFTGDATLSVVGTLAGGACGIGAGVVANKAAVDVKAMRELAVGIKDNSKRLDDIAKELKSSCDRAETIQLDKKAMEALHTALEFFSKDLEKDDRIALQQQELDDKDARIAEMEAKMRMHGIN